MSPPEGDGLVDLVVEGGDWSAFGDLQAVAEKAAGAALHEAGLDPAAFEISLMFADDQAIAALNRRFRGMDKPTNVLSWPAADLRPPAPGARPPAPAAGPGRRTPLGDVALAAGVVAKECAEKKIAADQHLTHLIAHGVLHLLGYDHETEADATLMEGLERSALGRLGIDDPYG